MVWIGMALLALLALVLVARPWLSRSLTPGLRRRSANVAAYRMRLREIEADLAAGVIATEAAAALKHEQAQRLLSDENGDAPPPEISVERRRRGVGLALGLLPILLAGLWYLQDGSWKTADEIALGKVPSTATVDAPVKAMVGKLEQDLRAHPDNAQGWALLGRSRMVLQQYDRAAKAYAEANARSGSSNPDWLVGEGQALALADRRDLQGKPAQLFEAALKIAPDDPRALWYAGLVAAQRGNKARATQLWQRLADQNIPKDVRTALEDQIRRLGGDPSDLKAPAQDSKPVALHLKIELAPALRSRPAAAGMLFVYARPESGSSMPLAVQRIAHPHFPVTVVLDDHMAVMPTAKLSDYHRWVVTARLSGSSDAKPETGDLEGRATVDRADVGRSHAIVIDHVRH